MTAKLFSNNKTMFLSHIISKYYINKNDINPKTEIFLFNYGEILEGHNYSLCKMEDLPKEIKDRLL